MKILVILSDGGQNYIELDLACGLIHEVRPSLLAGWKGTKAKYSVGIKSETSEMKAGESQKITMTTSLSIGDKLPIELHNGYSLALKYPIFNISGKE
jgi:hypothetical protein